MLTAQAPFQNDPELTRSFSHGLNLVVLVAVNVQLIFYREDLAKGWRGLRTIDDHQLTMCTGRLGVNYQERPRRYWGW